MFDVIIIGAGASGLMCAIHAGRKGLRVLVLEKNQKAGIKILVSGGSRCNFTNIFADPKQHYLSENPRFCISALSRYTPADFIAMVESHDIAFHEKTLGQLFCDESSKEIQEMLLSESEDAGVELRLNHEVKKVSKNERGFVVETEGEQFVAAKVVLACGGLSLPKIVSDLAYRTAEKFDVPLVAPRAGLVPFTWNSRDKEKFASLSGVSFPAITKIGKTEFRESVLFTHRGLSGPAILQISSFWQPGQSVQINCLPDVDAGSWILSKREQNPKRLLSTVLKEKLPKRFVDTVAGEWFEESKIGSCDHQDLEKFAKRFSCWEFMPGGTEGYRTAEVTLGGISTDALSAKTFELKEVEGLFAIGEAVDVTGWLGGFNFQWAWASGYCCALHL